MFRRFSLFVFAFAACAQSEPAVTEAPIDIKTFDLTTTCATYDALTMTHTTGGATSGGWNIWSNGSVSKNHTFVAGQTTITVNAAGQRALGVWPLMSVWIGNTKIGSASVSSTAYAAYPFTFTAAAGTQTLRVQFDNDALTSTEDRNLLVKNVAVTCPLQADTATYTFENGATHGFTAQGARSVASSTAQAFKGEASLAVAFNTTGGTQSARLATTAPAGATINFNVYCAAGVSWVQPYANAPWTGAYTAVPTFALGKWNALSLTAPAGITEIGVQFRVNSGFSGSCYIDSIGWNGAPPPPADTTAPTITLAAPVAGIVTAAAADNVGIAGVTFTVDGVAQSEDTSAPYTFDASALAAGVHTITARARDAAGNTTTSASLSVTIANPPPVDTTAPTITLAAPVAGIVTAAAADNVGIAGVTFTVDSLAKPEDTSAPYTFDTLALAVGVHTITARARDAAGNTTTSAALSVTIVAPPPPPPGGVIEPGSPGVVDVAFTVRADVGTHTISPLIYGSNTVGQTTGARLGLQRLGGNRWTAYNWENNASNAGSDYNFQNDAHLSSSNVPGAAVKGHIDNGTSVGAATLLTIPILDYVAADKNGGGDVRNSGSNYLQTRFKQNRITKGSALSTTPDTSDAYVYQDEFVNWAKNAAPNANLLFNLDNEPDLWADTHAEIHPNNVGYDELVNRNISAANMVKSLVPSAKVAGFVSYGFLGYINLQNAPDASGKGEFIDYYLTKMKAAETQYGKRLIDYLDLHWYPEAKGGGVRIIGNDTSAASVTARLQAPRSLWDSTYRETSWVADYLGGPINLIPREHAKIAARYPGTKLAFTEWNYGGGNHISGALAVADVLGIFGRDDVGMATYWDLNGAEAFVYAAFRAYRNFDGQGARFGDTSMHADTSRADMSSVYASYDAANPSRVVIIAINKLATATKAGITLAHAKRFTSARVYTVTSSGAQVSSAGTVSTVATNAFSYTMPPYSISVLVPE